MDKLTIKDPAIKLTRWHIEKSHMVAVPKFVDSITLENLRRRVQEIADSKKTRSDRPAIGPLTFRYELDKDEQPVVVHAYFTDRHDIKRRFMRLRRAP